ncbi:MULTISPECIES: phosphonate C-P lyase system protein PhnH [Cyanophyceae]|uniref:Carbon-phosphorus lyase subunit PhnH n=1 Tax=Nodularia spumigena CENA596 TaxID=1819295 RepID=A0A161XJ25_NODSP|nr:MULTISPECIES: phosphonate C-P lyase system protein PhnH [Cyanophyceae]MDB9358382.1 phosphonate C-P lyase system protein PhnH [Nodularia spumigena CS-587/03]KZL48474.1 carbon-phosphorus lyase subunit PhnH [Nodularia spumigena CENA596]MDB9305883.1 phosphonate C-P lyase system protein PhnH [Nodularia spumigena CS-591/12]MDB9316570.1 phosphonate C-P lyase system protein PhnH [Nodularia spumigena CS-590/01A]MDB9324151.1 phosphonate C-P lyase system protein PhnH [Nodularia spumigena CS-591/07A]
MSNIVTHLPGFQDSIHDSQQTFRALLDANARPGIPKNITAQMSVPLGLKPACGAACLTLLDLDVVVWLQPSFATPVREWLLFQTGCRLTQYPDKADFALIQDLAALPELSIFNMGTGEKPEASTTFLIQIENFEMGQPVILTGPGILEQQAITPLVPCHFWDFCMENHQAYPQGVDIFLFTESSVMGLPRTAKAEVHHDS